MLPRAARRRNVFHHLRQSTEQLALPWLCPATLRYHMQLNRPETTSKTSVPSHSEHRRRTSVFQPARHLATATDIPPVSQTGGYVPFENFDYGTSSRGSRPDTPQFSQSLYDEPAIMIKESELVTMPIFRRTKGVGGTLEDLAARFTISVRSGDLDMAALTLDRMSKFPNVDSEFFLQLHNTYLEAVVDQMITTRRSDEALSKALAMQTWFEVKLPRSTLKPDSRTMAIMLRMALRMLHGSKRDRTVRRYWNMVVENKFETEVLLMTDLLNDRDWGEISQLCPNQIPSDVQYDSEKKNADSVDALRPTEQKGLGLSSLQRTLMGINKDVDYVDSEEAKDLRRARQISLEKRAIETAQQRWYKEMDSLKAKGVNDASNNKTISLIMERWHRDLVDKINEELVLIEQEMKAPKSKVSDHISRERRDYGVYLRSMRPETLAAITVMHVIQVFTRSGIHRGIRVPVMVTGIGKEIQHELIAQKVLAENAEDHKRREAIKKIFENRYGRHGNMRFRKFMKEHEILDPNCSWPVNVTARVGSILMKLFFDSAKVAVPQIDPKTKEQFMFMEPAFQHSYEIERGRRFGVLHCHPEISRKLVRDKPAALQVRHMPMLSEPRPWTGFHEGGFLGHPSQIMRCSPADSLQKAYIKKALEDNGLPEIRSSLDILGKTAWTINKEVFVVMKEAWNTGKEYPNIPPLDPDIPKPPPPTTDSPADQASYNKKLRDLENFVSGLHSQRCFMNFQMEIAQAYLDETFFLPHNMDFRGRAYPIPAYLNQMGADNARGLLLFKKARPLGKSGLSWLKVHIASIFGFDKASFQEREEFTMQHLDDVLDSANNGLHGRQWFFQAEDPWQCLAACIELRNALRLEDPTQYMSRLPIHQDGSCNGLQHYAALGGDLQGAQHVNLEPGDRPKDIYTGVCDFVRAKVAEDAANGHEIAKLLDGKIKRKIVKQTVMTNVYGVTFIGAVRQVRRQLSAHYPDLEPLPTASTYVTRAIFGALGSLFSGAHSIQYWLGDCASRICQSISPDQLDELAKHTLGERLDKDAASISKELQEEDMEEEEEMVEKDPLKMFKSSVIWTSPLGLPVVQPYRTVKTRRIMTSLQSLTLQQEEGGPGGVVNKRKQLQAFPPNFIHSLDATHMMLSAIECNRKGLTFAAVHDSFWTHAGDVDTMNSALREAFIRMHSDNITKRLAAEFRVRYAGYLFLARIPDKNPIAQCIRKHRRKNKSTMLTELMLEYQRQKLLQSEDPELQAKGRAMTTGASIYQAMNGTDDDLAIASTLGETATGCVNEERKESERVYSAVDEKDPAIASLFTDLDPQFLEFETSKTDDVPESPAAADKPKPKTKSTFTWVWLPLTFRDVPAKGEFDVSRLRDSKYFFS